MALKDYHEVLKKYQTQIDLGRPYAMCDIWLRVEPWNKLLSTSAAKILHQMNPSYIGWYYDNCLGKESVLPPNTFAFKKLVLFPTTVRHSSMWERRAEIDHCILQLVCVCTGPKCFASSNWPKWRRNGQRLDKAKDIFQTTRLKNEKLPFHKPLLWSSLLTLKIYESYQIPQFSVTESF